MNGSKVTSLLAACILWVISGVNLGEHNARNVGCALGFVVTGMLLGYFIFGPGNGRAA